MTYLSKPEKRETLAPSLKSAAPAATISAPGSMPETTLTAPLRVAPISITWRRMVPASAPVGSKTMTEGDPAASNTSAEAG
ncbi:MAG: hypothetical protein AAGF13_10765, partial [Pseudomonadota bacterium]